MRGENKENIHVNWSLKDPVGFQVTHSRLCTPGTVGTWQNPYPSGGNGGGKEREEEGREVSY